MVIHVRIDNIHRKHVYSLQYVKTKIGKVLAAVLGIKATQTKKPYFIDSESRLISHLKVNFI